LDPFDPFYESVVGSTVFDPPYPSEDILAPLSATLNPGSYALIFGTDRFGASARGGVMPDNNMDIPGAASYILWRETDEVETGWHESTLFQNLRFVVRGTVIPEPATWLLATVAMTSFAIRRIRRKRLHVTLIAAVAVVLIAVSAPARAATLEGQTVTTRMTTAWPHGLPTPSHLSKRVVGPGTEIMDDFFQLDVDFSDTNILITNRQVIGWDNSVLYVSFQDTYAAIPRFTEIAINPATNWNGFDSSRLSFGPNDIFLDLTDTGALMGEQISLDITAIIPEPATWVLAAVASAYLGLRRRRSRRLPDKFLVGLPLATAIAIGTFIAGPAYSQSYRATILNPAGSTYSFANGNSETSQVGFGRRAPTPNDDHAFLWHGTAESVVDLHPAGFPYSAVSGVEGNSQVGSAWNHGPGDDGHAFLWHGTAESAIDLHPTGFRLSVAAGLSGTSQVGYGEVDFVTNHALLWHGSAESVMDLHPAGFRASFAGGVFEDTQVGHGYKIDGERHALLWHGTAESVVDLHPAGFTGSEVWGVSEGTQVGIGEMTVGGFHALVWHGAPESVVDLHPAGYSGSFAEFSSGDSQVGFGFIDVEQHALLWHGTPESVVDLHPVGFDRSRVSGVSGNRQVGYAENLNRPGPDHAMLWTGTAESAVDLHLSLEGLGIEFRGSQATGIAENGDVVGWAADSSGRYYAVLWKLVPEPSTGVLFCCGLLTLGYIRRRAHLSIEARPSHTTLATAPKQIPIQHNMPGTE
jgi:hypothetical protein